MKNKIIAVLLALLTLLSAIIPISSEKEEVSEIYSIFSDKQIDYNTYTYEFNGFNMTVDITSYADDSVKSNDSLIVYVINHMGERIGTEKDEFIIADYLAQGYVVTVLDYKGQTLAVSPYIESSVQQIRYDIINNGKYTGVRTVNPDKSYVLPAGYRLARDVVYFEMSKSASQEALNSILETYNTSQVATAFYYYPYKKASDDVPDAEHPFRHMVDVIDGKYSFKDEYKAKSLYDIIMTDGTKMTDEDMQLKMDIVYPSDPVKETPVAVLAASGTPRAGNAVKPTRQHSIGFLFRGYTSVCYDHEYFPFMNVDAGGWDDGLASRYGTNINYTTQTFDAVKTHTAAIRCIKYYADKYGYSKSKIGVYGHSKSSYISLLTSTGSENMVESNKHSGIPIGEQPFLTYEDGTPINADITCAYHSMGNGSSRSRYIVNSQSVPTMIACGQKDTGNGCSYWEAEKTAYRLSNSEFIAMDMIDIGHDYPNGIDPVYDYDRYDAFCKFFDYYLKDIAPELMYTSIVDGKIKGIQTTTYAWSESQNSQSKQWKEIDGGKLFVQFTAPVTEWSFLKAVSLKDSNGNDVEGSWYAEGNGNKWIFDGELSSTETYILTVADNTVKDKYGRVVKKGYNTESDNEMTITE